LDHDRNTYIGSSDARDIKTGNWLKVWAEKTGRTPREDLSDNFKVQLGVWTEQFHLNWTFKRLQAEADGIYTMSKDYKGKQHWATYGVCGSHPDAILEEGAGDTTPLEVKHSGGFRFRDAAEAARFYMPQLQHHMMCFGSDNICFSIIRGNEEPERTWVGRSQPYIDDYYAKCQAFWEHIEQDREPAPFLEHKETPDEIKINDQIPLNGKTRRSIQTDNHASVLIGQFLETKDAVTIHNSAKSQLKAMMADNEAELYCDELVLKRNKAGSILFKVQKKEEQPNV
tara:strand:- start:2016 stop:2867 length:852 start_codon:yes stop_codon:yes gene_type:complete